MQQKIRNFSQDSQGSIVVEFALAVPVFISILLGLFELGNYLQLNMKVYHTSVTIADLITRDETITETGINDIFNAAEHIMAPYPIGDQSRVIITNIHKPADEDARILWQRSGAGTLSVSSDIGSAGEIISSLPGITLHNNESIIIAEIYFDYDPIIAPDFTAHQLYKATYYRPRIGALTSIDN